MSDQSNRYIAAQGGEATYIIDDKNVKDENTFTIDVPTDSVYYVEEVAWDDNNGSPSDVTIGILSDVSQMEKNSSMTKNWTATSGGSGNSNIGYDSNNFYYSNSNGIIYAISRSDGSLQWDYDTNEDFQQDVVSDGANVFAATNGVLYGFDASSGNNYLTISLDSTSVSGAPIVYDDTYVYVGTDGGTIYSFAKSDGTQNWSDGTYSDLAGSGMDIDGSTIYHTDSSNGTLYSVSTADGSENWATSLGSNTFSPVYTDGSDVYASSGTTFYSINASDGTQNWSTTLNATMSANSIVDDGTYVYIGLDTPEVNSVEKSTGTVNWTTTTDGTGITGMGLSSGTLFVGSANTPTLYAIDSGTGTITHEESLSDAINMGIGADSGEIFFSNNTQYSYSDTVFNGVENTRAARSSNNASPSSDGSLNLGKYAYGGETIFASFDSPNTDVPFTLGVRGFDNI